VCDCVLFDALCTCSAASRARITSQYQCHYGEKILPAKSLSKQSFAHACCWEVETSRRMPNSPRGRATIKELAELMLEQETRGKEVVNFPTPQL